MITDYAVQLVATILVVLLVLMVILIFTTWIRRFFLNRSERLFSDSETYTTTLLYRYLDGELSAKEFSAQLRGRYDIITSYKAINLLIDNLRGKDLDHLHALIELEAYKRYFKKKLKDESPIQQAHACIYFEQRRGLESDIAKRLEPLQLHPYSVLGYAATLALLSSTDETFKEHVVEVFLHKKENASMAVNDIVFKFVNEHSDKERAAHFLMRMASSSYIPPKTASYVIRMFPELGFFHLADDLKLLLIKPKRTDYSGLITAAILDALRQLSYEDVEPEIHQLELYSSNYQPIRLSVAKWYKDHPNLNRIDVLRKLANDVDLEVRIEALKALVKLPETEQQEAYIQEQFKQEWQEMKGWLLHESA